MPGVLEEWMVLHMYSHVASKDKFHVVCCTKPKSLAFLINSNLTDFVKKNPLLVACNALISADGHDFLKYDSYVACCEPVSLAHFDEQTYKIVGSINDMAKHSIIKAVTVSPSLVSRQKAWILEALG